MTARPEKPPAMHYHRMLESRRTAQSTLTNTPRRNVPNRAITPRRMLLLKDRNQALWHGVLGIFGPIVGLLGASPFVRWLQLDSMGVTMGVVVWLSLVGALAAVVFGVWKLGVARDRRWDARGIIALGLMAFFGYPQLIFLVWWVVTGLLAQMGLEIFHMN